MIKTMTQSSTKDKRKDKGKRYIPSGHVLKSTLDARFLACPAAVVLTTSNLNPASCNRVQHHNKIQDKI